MRSILRRKACTVSGRFACRRAVAVGSWSCDYINHVIKDDLSFRPEESSVNIILYRVETSTVACGLNPQDFRYLKKWLAIYLQW